MHIFSYVDELSDKSSWSVIASSVHTTANVANVIDGLTDGPIWHSYSALLKQEEYLQVIVITNTGCITNIVYFHAYFFSANFWSLVFVLGSFVWKMKSTVSLPSEVSQKQFDWRFFWLKDKTISLWQKYPSFRDGRK